MIIGREPTKEEIEDAQRRGWDGVLWILERVPDKVRMTLEEQIDALLKEAA